MAAFLCQPVMEMHSPFAENVNKFGKQELIFLLSAERAPRKRLISPQLSESLIFKIMETVTNVNFFGDRLLTIPIVKHPAQATLNEKAGKK